MPYLEDRALIFFLGSGCHAQHGINLLLAKWYSRATWRTKAMETFLENGLGLTLCETNKQFVLGSCPESPLGRLRIGLTFSGFPILP